MAKNPSKKEESAEALAGAGGSIDQIREILFGSAQRQIDSRFAAAEKSLATAAEKAAVQLAEARDALTERSDALDSRLETQIESVLNQLDKTQSELEESIDTVQRKLSDDLSALEKQIRQAMADQASAFEKKLKVLEDELYSTAARLEEEKTGKQDLGDYLMEIGLRLKGDRGLAAIQSSVGAAVTSEGDQKASE